MPGRILTEIGAPDLFRIQSGSYDLARPVTMSSNYEILEISGDGITPVSAQGVKSRLKLSRRFLSLQVVLGDVSSSLRQDLADAENATDMRVEITFTSGSAYIAYPSCSILVGERMSTGDDSINAMVVDISSDGYTLDDIRTYFNVTHA